MEKKKYEKPVKLKEKPSRKSAKDNSSKTRTGKRKTYSATEC